MSQQKSTHRNDYFTKWVKAASYANVTKQVVVRFVKNNLICRYGVPSRIITDNGSNLNNKMHIVHLCLLDFMPVETWCGVGFVIPFFPS